MWLGFMDFCTYLFLHLYETVTYFMSAAALSNIEVNSQIVGDNPCGKCNGDWREGLEGWISETMG